MAAAVRLEPREYCASAPLIWGAAESEGPERNLNANAFFVITHWKALQCPQSGRLLAFADVLHGYDLMGSHGRVGPTNLLTNDPRPLGRFRLKTALLAY